MADLVKDETAPQPEVVAAPDAVKDDAPVETKAVEEKPVDSKEVDKNEETVETGDAAEEQKQPDIVKTKASINREDYSANRKFDASVLPVTDDPEKIRAQVEFYFGDSNLPQDKFLWNLTGGPENNPVKVKKICSFSRMRRFQPYEAVVAALRESPVLNVSGEEGDEEITRKKPYESSRNRKNEGASIYAKGFGDEEPSTQFDIEAFFTKFGTVNSVRLRRTVENLFKGSVFVEFQTEEQAKSFLALEPKPQWKGHDLKIMSKKAYVDEKNQLIQEGKMQPSAARSARFWEGKESGSDGRGRGRGRGGRDFKSNIDRDDWKKRRDDDQKNGFRDRHNRNSRGRGRGGRGRGNRDDRRDDRRDRTERSGNDVRPPTIKATNDKGEAVADVKSDAPTNSKRARDEDHAGEEPPAKKVDAKSEVTAEAS